MSWFQIVALSKKSIIKFVCSVRVVLAPPVFHFSIRYQRFVVERCLIFGSLLVLTGKGCRLNVYSCFLLHLTIDFNKNGVLLRKCSNFCSFVQSHNASSETEAVVTQPKVNIVYPI